MNTFIILVVVTDSQVAAYLQTRQIVCIKNVQFFFFLFKWIHFLFLFKREKKCKDRESLLSLGCAKLEMKWEKRLPRQHEVSIVRRFFYLLKNKPPYRDCITVI